MKQFVIALCLLFNGPLMAQLDQDSLWGIWSDEELNDTVRLRALSAFAWNGYLFSYPDSAFYFGQMMYDHAEKKGMKMQMAYALRGQGVTFKVRDRDAKALDYFLRSMEISEEANDLAGVAGSLNNIGILYFEQGDHARSLEYHQRSLRMREECGDVKGVGASFNSIGKIHEVQGDIDVAMEYFLASLENAERIGFGLGVAYSLINIGNVHRHRGELEQALDHYQRGLKLHEKENDQLSQASDLNYMGLAYIELGDRKSALTACAKALSLANALGNVEEQRKACQCMYAVHKEKGDKEVALQFLERATRLNDSLRKEVVYKKLQRMEFANEWRADSVARAEKELRMELENQAALSHEKNSRNMVMFAGVGVLALSIGMWSRLRYISKAKEEADTLRRRAEVSERAKHQFLANMSHEIRTPMNAIMGMTGILLRNAHAPEQDRYLDAIKHSSENLLVILNDILDLSKIESGRIDLERIPFEPRSVIRGVHDIMQFKAEEKGLEFQTEIITELPSVLLGDPTRLRQVLLNLVGNAIKFTEKGSITIRAAANVNEDGTCIARFDVQDTGIGIPLEKQEKIFQEFDQAYSDTSRRYGGSGLGLTISKRLVEMQGGSITVKSTKGEGSVFTVTLPFGIGVSTELQSAPRPLSSWSDLQILLAEDNEFNAIVAHDELVDAIPGVVVDVATNGQEAVDLVRAGNYDLVLMDVQMPEMNGYDATKAIRDLGGSKAKIPIVAMTANVMKEEVQRCKDAGMNGFIPKPFKREELLNAIQLVLEV